MLRLFNIYSVVLLSSLVAFNLNADTKSIDKSFLGKWTALSRTHMNILGELEITKERLNFSKAGSFSYQMISKQKDRFLLRLDKKIDGVYYVGIGPVKKSKSLVENKVMDLALYKTKDKGLIALSKQDPMKECSLWGVYIPRISN